MTRKVIPGGWQADYLPNGNYVALVPKVRMETSIGPIAFPEGETFGVLYPRLNDTPHLDFAGQAHDRIVGAQLYVQGAGWITCPGLCPGENPTIYDHAGQLHINNGSAGSQGYRYVAPDGTLVTGDQTLAALNGVNEWTDLSLAQDRSLLLGQYHAGHACVLWDGAAKVLRLVDDGDAYFIRGNRQGDVVAIAMMKAEGSVLIMTTIAELLARPPVGQPAPVVRVPGPIHTQPVTPESRPMSAPFDPSAVTFVDNPSDLASWAETAAITSVEFPAGRICVDHNKRSGPNAWPDAPFGDGSSGTCQYTLGLCMQIGGKWYGSAVIQFWQGRDLSEGGDESGIAKDWYYDTRWSPLTGHQPAPGELVAWFVAAGNLRDNMRIGVRERSNFLVLPFGQTYANKAPGPVVNAPPPIVNVPPTPAAPDAALLESLLARVAALERAALEPRRVAIRTENERYLCAEDGGGGAVNATRQTAGGWETFTLEPKS